jgi:Zn-dependent M28 family amino/carboxypeptidase
MHRSLAISRKVFFGVAVFLFIGEPPAKAQQLLAPDQYRIIRENSSGERPFADFKRIVRFSGYSPAHGADEVANYLATEAKSMGLSNVAIERYPSDGKSYYWAFHTEPLWEARKGELWLVKPEKELLADFTVFKSHLGRNSRTGSVTAELVDVGSGVSEKEYDGRSVEGKVVLASGAASRVMRLAVWERKAAGVVFYRTEGPMDHPDLIGTVQLVPWIGPHGEDPTFAFSLSYRVGSELKARLALGEKLSVHSEVEVETGPGEYPEVRAEIPGTDPSLPAILVYAHDNSRNTGGANNLTGVGCTLEVARLLSNLVSTGDLPRPRRTIRFMWGSEHYGITYHFHEHPEDLQRILAMINIDMIGYDQQSSGAVFHLYRSPNSNPSFLDDAVQAFIDKVGIENTIAIRNSHFLSARPTEGFLDPLFAPTGSREQFHYSIEPFWGPSDHEDAQTLGVQAILLNDFPDVFLGTQEDTPKAGDPTQMRRGVVIAASSAYYLASVGADDLPALLHNATTKAAKRFADDETKAFRYLESAKAEDLPQAFWDATNVVKHGFSRESGSLTSLSRLVGDQGFKAQADPLLADFQARERAALQRLESYANARASQLHVAAAKLKDPGADAKFRSVIPERSPDMRGPVNFFRPEYGRWWLIEKTGDEHFDQKVALAQRGEYFMYEALNFADGKRNVVEIRDAVSAEFEPVPVAEVAQYFEFLQKLGVVRMAPAK